MGAAVVTHGDAAPIFQTPEHDLDFMALFIQGFIVVDRNLAVLFAGDTRRDVPCAQFIADPIGIIASIGKEGASFG